MAIERNAWVIVTNKHGFEEVVSEVLEGKGRFWFNWSQLYRPTSDIFDTEQDARNECEKRLYNRLVALNEHRERMSRLCVDCAPPMPEVRQ